MFAMYQNVDSILFDGLKPKPRESVFVFARRFTTSMTTIVTPPTIQQQRENPLVDIVSNDENMFPNHEIAHDNECNEHSYLLTGYLHVELNLCQYLQEILNLLGRIRVFSKYLNKLLMVRYLD